MGPPVVFLVLGMGSLSLLAAVTNDQGVLGIAFELVTVIFGAASALTIWLAADALIGPKLAWREGLLAIRASTQGQAADSSEVEMNFRRLA